VIERITKTDSAAARVAAVARKEAVDIFRDRRAVLVTLITAIVAGPVMMLLVLNLVARQADRAREMTLPVVGSEHAPALVAFLERQQVKLTAAPADYEDRVRSGDIDVVLEIDKEFGADVAKGKPATVRLVFDRSRDRARSSIAEAEALLRAYSREWGRGRLLLRGVAGEVANPLNVESRDLATPQSSGALVLFLIAFYGLFAAVMGGMAAALDTTAGERERASLEPLLTTPVAPLELATGKWLAVVALDAIAVVLTLSGFYLVLRFAPLPAVGIPFLFGLAELGRFVVALVPLMLLMPAILLYVGSRGRSFKEAQSNLSVLLFAISLIPIVQMFLQRKEPAWLTWIPISGQYALLARALRGEALPALELAQSYVVPMLLTAVALVAVARLFSRESILAGK
jgi:sodium transport system permease protein